jgi:hypothetical protein
MTCLGGLLRCWRGVVGHAPKGRIAEDLNSDDDWLIPGMAGGQKLSDEDFNILVRSPEKTLCLQVYPSDLIENVKGQIQAKGGIRPKDQVLMFKNEELANGETLEGYNIEKDSTLELAISGEINIVRASPIPPTPRQG